MIRGAEREDKSRRMIALIALIALQQVIVVCTRFSCGEPHDNKEPTLEIAVPYLAATYDERMFDELYRRAQLFEVTMGGDLRVEDRFDPGVLWLDTALHPVVIKSTNRHLLCQ